MLRDPAKQAALEESCSSCYNQDVTTRIIAIALTLVIIGGLFILKPIQANHAIETATKALGTKAHLVKRAVDRDTGLVTSTYEVPDMSPSQVAALLEPGLSKAGFRSFKNRFLFDYTSAYGSVSITGDPLDKGSLTHYTTMCDLGRAGKTVAPIVDHRIPAGEPRFYSLGRMAKDDFEAGNIKLAISEANELMAGIPKYADDNADEIQDANTVLGRVAVSQGRIADAKRYLVAAGKHGGSPVLSSFGPSMSLARDLLKKGQRDAVLQYLAECRSFWKGDGAIDGWISDVKAGRMPDFGANVDY